jgi:hypothetical protein
MAVPPDFFSSDLHHRPDQLGLRLRAAKVLVEWLVINHPPDNRITAWPEKFGDR